MGGNQSYSVPSHGWTATSTPANPAAGANWTWTVPTEAGAAGPLLFIDIESICFSLQCVGVGNRDAHIQFMADVSVLGYAVAGTSQPNLTTWIHCCAPGIEMMQLGTRHHYPMPDLKLESGNIVQSAIAGLQAVDQVTNVRIRYRKWYTN